MALAVNLTSDASRPWGVRASLQLGASELNDRDLCHCFCEARSAFPLLELVRDPEKAAQTPEHYRKLIYTTVLP